MIIKIIASHPVRYSLSNGFNQSEFDPGEFYDVPEYVVRGMMARGWAEPATKEQLTQLAAAARVAEPATAQRPAEPTPEPPPEPMPRRPVEEPRRENDDPPPRPPRHYDDDERDDDDAARAQQRDPRPRRRRETVPTTQTSD